MKQKILYILSRYKFETFINQPSSIYSEFLLNDLFLAMQDPDTCFVENEELAKEKIKNSEVLKYMYKICISQNEP